MVDECVKRKLGEIKSLVEETLAEKGDNGIIIKPKKGNDNQNNNDKKNYELSQQQQQQQQQ